LDSIWVFYSNEGKILRSISYERNLKNGELIVYDSTELIQFLGQYKDDTLQGPFKRYLNGKLLEEGNYKNGLLEGKLKEFDPENGNLIALTDFKEGKEGDGIDINRTVAGKKSGLWQKYDDKGNLIQQEVYLNGELINNDRDAGAQFNFEKDYFTDGGLKSQYMKLNGYKNGIQTNYDSLGNQLASFSYKNDTLLAKGWFNSDGSKDSLWEYYSSNNKINAKGSFKDGVKDGLWIYYFLDRSIEQKGRYRENLPHGEWIWYYPNGQVRREENYYKGKYEGEVKDYDTFGKLIQSRNYVFNNLEGDLFYFIGDHQEVGKMQNGLREGKSIYYYGEKEKAFVGKFKDGFPEGKHKYWFGNGRRAYVMKYKNGKLHGKMIEYIESGGVNHVYIYKNGKLKTLDGEALVEKKISR
jgi:antitoxin component YwqK of YwqJK toxin-antitoxin module